MRRRDALGAEEVQSRSGERHGAHVPWRATEGSEGMNIAITFRQMESTDAVKGYAQDKIGRLQRFLREPMKGQVKLSCQSRQHSAEVDIHAGGSHYHAHETSEDMYASIDKVLDKLERQIRGNKSSQKGKERASQRLIHDESGEE